MLKWGGTTMHEIFQSLAELPSEVRPWLYAAGTLAILIFLGGVFNRASIWLNGRDEPGNALYPLTAPRLLWLSLMRFFAPDCFFVRRVFANSRLRGIMISAIIWSAVALAFGVGFSALTFVSGLEVDEMLDQVLGLVMDLAGGILLIGLLASLARRFFFRPARYIPLAGDAAIVLLFFVTVLSGLVLESTHVAERIAYTQGPIALAALPSYSPPLHGATEMGWYWQPFGALIAWAGLALGLDVETFEAAHVAVYLFHAISAFLLIAYLPLSKLFHLFASQITTYARAQEPRRAAWPLKPRSPEKI
jgi:nitrate reductase gamma subunit